MCGANSVAVKGRSGFVLRWEPLASPISPGVAAKADTPLAVREGWAGSRGMVPVLHLLLPWSPEPTADSGIGCPVSTGAKQETQEEEVEEEEDGRLDGGVHTRASLSLRTQ